MSLMNSDRNSLKTVDDYIAIYPTDVQTILNKIRDAIKQAAPDAMESIAYGMPSYKLDGRPLVYFAAFKNHIGFYATPEAHEEFSSKLSKYKQGKGSVQFPLDQPIPYELIFDITKFKIDLLNKKL